MRTVAGVIVLCMFTSAPARCQSITIEAAVSTGYSTDDSTAAAATQVRAFGDAVRGVRYFAEAAWAATTNDDVDAFAAAYPYGNRVQVIEAYAERMFAPAGGLLGVKAGRYRTPFGISNGSDYAYTGFLRAPLLRYNGYFALSNDFLEHGVDVIAGVPRLTVEASAGVPADVGLARRRSGGDAVVRAQSYLGSFIIGASYIHTQPYQAVQFAHGAADFWGVDARWMRGGVQLRGEWITGHPFDGTSTTGWYTDLIVHHLGMGPVTAVARIEQLTYDAIAPFDLHARRQTMGARIRLMDSLALQVNLLHQTGAAAEYRSVPIDLGVTYTVRRY